MTNRLLLLSLVLGAAIPLHAAEVPDKEDIKTMAEESMTSFGEALKDKDFTAFYEDIAELWKKQITPEKLMEAFKSMAGPNFDILGIVKELEPSFSPAEINSSEVLVIKGFYPTKPKRLTFELKYIQEEEEWKLVGINAKTED